MAILEMAGHQFNLGMIGSVRCVKPNCRVEGGAFYIDVLAMQESDIGKSVICHNGSTTQLEYESVVKERDRISATFKS